MTQHQGTAKCLNRPVFFDRQSLNAQDLNCLVDYVRQVNRRHNRHVVGWGVTCGLSVTIADQQPWRVQVGAGHAITPSGEEISVPDNAAPFDICEAARACLDIPGPCPAPFDLESEHVPVAPADVGLPGAVPFSEREPGTELPNPVELGWATITIQGESGHLPDVAIIDEMSPIIGLNMGVAALITLTKPSDSVTLTLARGAATPMLSARNGAGDVVDEMAMTGPTLTPQTLTLTGDGIETIRIIAKIPELFLMGMRLPLQTGSGAVYLAICPDDTPQCYKPGVPEYCRPPDDNMFPARICEGYKFDILCDLPPGHMPPDCDELREMICGPMHIPCPPDDGPDCVIIATITANENGILAIDEFAHRRRLIPQWVLAEREVCRCNVQPTIPPTEPTRFTEFTRFSEPTRFTELTEFSEPTRFTEFTRFSEPTRFTEFTRFSEPTRFTGFTRFSEPTGFTGFTEFSEPSRFTQISRFTGLAPSEIVIPPGGLEFDPIHGNALDITLLGDVGPVRRDRLRKAGITNLTEFIGRESAELARIMRVSEVKVAQMQEEARIKTMEVPR